ncbi:hypothetical protein BpHYR1_006848 [Brachionus plicatilis]|uniref:Uncharacterized protein n=1 Tax=Brachionus plicatilis TaxID=10195 RepID=A0A3M7PAB2_BRAPC|nr:hypothetical protein BpHYR1_006848 [Brachionus plicatilis]
MQPKKYVILKGVFWTTHRGRLGLILIYLNELKNYIILNFYLFKLVDLQQLERNKIKQVILNSIPFLYFLEPYLLLISSLKDFALFYIFGNRKSLYICKKIVTSIVVCASVINSEAGSIVNFGKRNKNKI